MANIIPPTNKQTPIYIYSSCNSGAVASDCTEANRRCLHAFGVEDSQIEILEDPSYLGRALNTSKGGTLILPGGSTFTLFSELDKHHSKIKEAAARGLNLFCQCSGANLISHELVIIDPEDQALSVDPISFFGFLPLRAICPALPVKTLGNFAENARMATIDSGDKSFQCYWNEGSYFQFQKPRVMQPVAYYQENERIAGAQADLGSNRIVALGIHPEMPPLEPCDEPESSKMNRKEFLETIFSFLKIVPTLNIDT